MAKPAQGPHAASRLPACPCHRRLASGVMFPAPGLQWEASDCRGTQCLQSLGTPRIHPFHFFFFSCQQLLTSFFFIRFSSFRKD